MRWTVAAAVLVALSCRGEASRSVPAGSSAPIWYDFSVVHTYPHDPQAFTQGLVYRDGVLFESTGLVGTSSLRRVRLETGEVLQQVSVPAPYFAEGLTDWRQSLVQLTWRSGTGFIYDMATFAHQRTFSYNGEGWGLTRDATSLIMSDGTATLRFLEPDTLRETRRVSVTDQGLLVNNLNELEWVKGQVYANVWQTDEIVMIEPPTGRVTARVDLSTLWPATSRTPSADVLNGIAYDSAGDRLFVTGKRWPRLYEIRLIRRQQ